MDMIEASITQCYSYFVEKFILHLKRRHSVLQLLFCLVDLSLGPNRNLFHVAEVDVTASISWQAILSTYCPAYVFPHPESAKLLIQFKDVALHSRYLALLFLGMRTVGKSDLSLTQHWRRSSLVNLGSQLQLVQLV